jgi:hypothetical protein
LNGLSLSNPLIEKVNAKKYRRQENEQQEVERQ